MGRTGVLAQILAQQGQGLADLFLHSFDRDIAVTGDLRVTQSLDPVEEIDIPTMVGEASNGATDPVQLLGMHGTLVGAGVGRRDIQDPVRRFRRGAILAGGALPPQVADEVECNAVQQHLQCFMRLAAVTHQTDLALLGDVLSVLQRDPLVDEKTNERFGLCGEKDRERRFRRGVGG